MMIEICVFGYETFWMRARRIHFWVWILHLASRALCASMCMCACTLSVCVRVWLLAYCFYVNFPLAFSTATMTVMILFFGWHHYGRCYTIEGAHSLHIHTPRSSRSVHPIEKERKKRTTLS